MTVDYVKQKQNATDLINTRLECIPDIELYWPETTTKVIPKIALVKARNPAVSRQNLWGSWHLIVHKSVKTALEQAVTPFSNLQTYS